MAGSKKKSMDVSDDGSLGRVQRKTERSHAENQERAYIAASRRTDRSLEARVQSARMASEIHKKRTGKGFRITEAIVLKEEMYEEEDEELPRSYRLLGPHMETRSATMNDRLNAFLSNKVVMSNLLATTDDEWRENEINKLFAQSFPNAASQAQQISQQQQQQQQHQQRQQQFSRQLQTPGINQSVPVQSHTRPQRNYLPSEVVIHDQIQGSHAALGMHQFSIPHQAEIQPQLASDTSMLDYRYQSEPGLDPRSDSSSPSDVGLSRSAFTPTIPLDAATMMNGSYFQPLSPETPLSPSEMQWLQPNFFLDTCQDHNMPSEVSLPETQKWDFMHSNPAMDEPWDTFIHDNAWGNEQDIMHHAA